MVKAYGKLMGCDSKIGTVSGRIRTIRANNIRIAITAFRTPPIMKQ